MIRLTAIAAILVFAISANAQTEVPNTFQSGQPARASEVNANFDALEAAIDQNTTSIQNIPAGPQGPQGPEGPQGPPGASGCSATQQDSNVIITCADGSSAVLASAGTVVIWPEGGVSGEPPVTYPTGEFVVVDATDVVLGLSGGSDPASTMWGLSIDVFGTLKHFTVRNNHTYQQVEILPVVVSSLRIFYLSTDCSGPVFNGGTNNWSVLIDGQFYVPGESGDNILSHSYRELTTTVDPSSGLSYYDFGQCIIGEHARNNAHLLYEFTQPSEWTNAVYPVRLAQLP